MNTGDNHNRAGMKTHKTAVVLLPPEEVWPPIQAIRGEHDRQFRRWMPHINLIYPFRPVTHFERLFSPFCEVCQDIAPFQLVLREIRTFHHGKERYTMWLKPEPVEPVRNLAEVLLKLVPDCDDVWRFPGGFTPHLSIGQVKGKQNRDRLVAFLQKNWAGVEFEVRAVYWIARRDPPDDIFRVQREIPFGRCCGL